MKIYERFKYTTEKLTKEQREKILKARELINYLDWSETKEGFGYWARVVEALERIANSNVKRCPHCKEVLEE